MIETAMLVGMGFCAATLVALLLMPLVSHRARRRVEQRFKESGPLDAREAAAERDGIRAIAAVEQRRAERRIEKASQGQAETQAELGRRAARIADLERTGEAERLRLSSELAQSRDACSAAEAKIASSEQALAEAQSRLRTLEEENRVATARRDEVTALAEERHLALARMTTSMALLEAQLADRDGALDRERQEASRARAAIADVTRDRDFARNQLLLASTQRTMLDSDLKDLNRRTEDLRDRHQARADDLASAERHLVEERAEKKAAEAALTELRLRFQALEARLIEAGGSAAGGLGAAELGDLRASVDAVSDQALATLAPGRAPSEGSSGTGAPDTGPSGPGTAP